MTNRTFGVEIECGFRPRISASHVRSQIRAAGLGVWSVGHDGTDIEIRTPILRGVKGLNKLKKALALIQDMGGYVTVRDGLHVHHGAREFRHDMGAIRKLVKSWYENQAVIEQMVSQSRRPGGSRQGACPRWTEHDLLALDQSSDLNWSRRSLNIASLLQHGTIEIRLHEGTLDFDEAKAWILFGQKFIEGVLAGHTPSEKVESTDALLKHIRLGYKSGAFLREKALLGGRRPSPAVPVTSAVIASANTTGPILIRFEN